MDLNVRTPEPKILIPQPYPSSQNSQSNSSSIYKTLHMHKRLPAGIGLRFNKSAQQCRNDAINEAEEEEKDETNKEDSDVSEEDDADSNEEESEDPEDSRQEESY